MTSTSPTFFKVRVSTGLIMAIELGQYPTPTIVEMHVPMMPRPFRCLSEGMRLLDNLSVILACFKDFKLFLTWSNHLLWAVCDLS
jgi:hypothetical protein